MESPYHHGSLREALITAGRRALIDEGVDGVSLRELARTVGVSHAAPRRHFADRNALLAAIADRGFHELTETLRAASTQRSLEARLSAYAHSYIRFALENGPLVTLMFSTKPGSGTGRDDTAASEFFALGAELLAHDPETPPGVTPYVVAATLEGISSLVIAGRLPLDRIDAVLNTAVRALATTIRDEAATHSSR